jgi:hypothetical protein
LVTLSDDHNYKIMQNLRITAELEPCFFLHIYSYYY